MSDGDVGDGVDVSGEGDHDGSDGGHDDVGDDITGEGDVGDDVDVRGEGDDDGGVGGDVGDDDGASVSGDNYVSDGDDVHVGTDGGEDGDASGEGDEVSEDVAISDSDLGDDVNDSCGDDDFLSVCTYLFQNLRRFSLISCSNLVSDVKPPCCCSLVPQSCPTLCNPMDCRLPCPSPSPRFAQTHVH